VSQSYAEAAAAVAVHTTAVLLLVVWLIHSQAPLAITLVGAAATDG
jgi:hypothetical protein